MQTSLPRTGLLGYWDRLVGPGMTQSELTLVLVASFFGAIFAMTTTLANGYPWPLVVFAAFIGLDVVGSAVCNTTWTTKAWYHRDGQTFWSHMSFIALHVSHVAVFAYCFRGEHFDWWFFSLVSCLLITSACLTLSVSPRLRLPVSAFCFSVSLALLDILPFSSLLGWFVPLLFLKLLIGHAVPPRLMT